MRSQYLPPCVALAIAVGVSACISSGQSTRPADERFGHRYDDASAAGRTTVVIAPADTNVLYFYYPAPFDTVHVRPAPFREGLEPELQELPVEVLVKGTFPDACTELDDLEQERSANIVNVDLTIRRPRGSVCAAVARPYRFYFMLPGQYRPGHYTLLLNEEIIPFQISAPDR
ncbi:MAG TPA: hypothetical protein VF190_15540 [Rhodothermales bacterium]